MKQSKYNFFFPLDNGKCIAFNALKNGMAVLPESLANKVQSVTAGTTPDLDDNTLAQLKKGGFLCPDDYDELGLLRIRHNMRQYSDNGLGLTIAPTLNCNLSCRYCFESPSPQVMDQKTIGGLTAFAEGYVKSGISRLSCSWYGGEPALCMDVIEDLSKRFIDLTSKNNVNYSAYIITNGTLYNRETAKKLKDLKVNGVQITLDGTEEEHNKKRPFKNGKGSFQTIWKNIKETVDILPISIRNNVDVANAPKMLKFYDLLRKEEWFKEHYGKNIRVHYGFIKKLTASCRCTKEESLKPGDFWENELKLHHYLYENGFGFEKYPDISSGCVATSINGYLVGPQGELYKCWNHLGDPQYVVGSIFEPVELNPMYISYLTDGFETDDECLACRFLPLCMGGCIDIRVKAKRGEMEAKDCASWKFYLEDALRGYYHAKVHPKPA